MKNSFLNKKDNEKKNMIKLIARKGKRPSEKKASFHWELLLSCHVGLMNGVYLQSN